MPKGSDWVNFIYVNLGFILQVVAMYYFSALYDIKKNWAKYRCNPMYMPLSDDLNRDFTYCVQTTQTNFMGYLLQPITYMISNLSLNAQQYTQSLTFADTLMSNVRNRFGGIVGNIYGILLNIIVQFMQTIIGIKDMAGKIIGIMVSILYILDGSVKTIGSTWNGPPGQMVRGLGSCFYPYTRIRLKNGEIVYMKDLNLGDILENGSRVRAVMRVENFDNKEKFYKLCGRGVDGDDIYVTGAHMVATDDAGTKFVKVENFKDALTQDEVQSSWFSNLITYDHKIKIGEQIFWDWEDYILEKNNEERAE
jgi:hypothetical protein